MIKPPGARRRHYGRLRLRRSRAQFALQRPFPGALAPHTCRGLVARLWRGIRHEWMSWANPRKKLENMGKRCVWISIVIGKCLLPCLITGLDFRSISMGFCVLNHGNCCEIYSKNNKKLAVWRGWNHQSIFIRFGIGTFQFGTILAGHHINII